MAETRKTRGEGAGGSGAALGDLVFVFGGPAVGGEVCAREMNCGG
jgi:hypothetical protein